MCLVGCGEAIAAKVVAGATTRVSVERCSAHAHVRSHGQRHRTSQYRSHPINFITPLIKACRPCHDATLCAFALNIMSASFGFCGCFPTDNEVTGRPIHKKKISHSSFVHMVVGRHSCLVGRITNITYPIWSQSYQLGHACDISKTRTPIQSEHLFNKRTLVEIQFILINMGNKQLIFT